MRPFLTGVTRMARRGTPALVIAASAALSLGAYSGYAAMVARHHPPARHTFTLAVGTRTVSLSLGSTTRVKVSIRRRHLRSAVSFRVVSKLPAGVSVRLTPTRSRGTHTMITIRAGSRIVARRYQLRLRGSSGRLRRTLILTLNLVRPGTGGSQTGQPAPFSVTGNVSTPLEPGSAQPIDAVLSNPNSLPLSVTGLVVTIQGVTAPQATSTLPCGPNDFAVQQYGGKLPLTVPASSSRSLSDLGIPAAQWPQISILDLPTNQDGCQGASLGLGFSGRGSLG
jgi:hypothetical protein